MSGTAVITITVGDGNSSALDSFVLSVDVNSPPEFTSTPVTSATEDITYTYAITATDLDAGDALTITATSLPAWLTLIDHGDRTASLGGTPTNADVGEHAIALQVQDPAGATAIQAFTITVVAAPIVVGKTITWTGALSADWSNPANWDDAIPTLLDSVLIPGSVAGGHWPVVDVTTAACKNLVIAPGAYLTVTNGMTLAVEGGLVNSGTLALQQVNGSPSEFHIRNSAGDVAYYGLAITPTAGYSLGLTTVTLRGNRDCTTHDPGDTIDRCFEISPTYQVTATAAFYYLDGERESFDPGDMQAWRWDTSVLTWTQAGSATAWGSTSGAWWVEVSGVSAYDSAYVLRSGLTHPTAVELRALRVERLPTQSSVPAGLLTAGTILLGLVWTAIRRRK
jgi:hypothetical protein